MSKTPWYNCRFLSTFCLKPSDLYAYRPERYMNLLFHCIQFIHNQFPTFFFIKKINILPSMCAVFSLTFAFLYSLHQSILLLSFSFLIPLLYHHLHGHSTHHGKTSLQDSPEKLIYSPT